MKRLILVIWASLFLLAVACGEQDKQKAGSEDVDHKALIKPRKIEDLTPELFVRLTLELQRREILWRDQWLRVIKPRLQGFFDSFGISAREFLAYPNKNRSQLDAYMEDKKWQHKVRLYQRLEKEVSRRRVYPFRYIPREREE